MVSPPPLTSSHFFVAEADREDSVEGHAVATTDNGCSRVEDSYDSSVRSHPKNPASFTRDSDSKRQSLSRQGSVSETQDCSQSQYDDDDHDGDRNPVRALPSTSKRSKTFPGMLNGSRLTPTYGLQQQSSYESYRSSEGCSSFCDDNSSEPRTPRRNKLMRAVRSIIPTKVVKFFHSSNNRKSNHQDIFNEDSPLLNMEEGRSSYLRQEEEDENNLQETTTNAFPRGNPHWRRITQHVQSGDVLLQRLVQDKSNFALRTKNNIFDSKGPSWDEVDESERQRLREQVQANIRNGVEFSLQQCVVAMLLYIVVAVLAFSFVFDNWTVIDSIYFAIVTFTTVGYGDLVPNSYVGRIFTVVYALSGVACLGIALGVLGTNIVEAQERAVRRASQIAKARTMSLLASPEIEAEQAVESPLEQEILEQVEEVAEEEKSTATNPFIQLLQTFALVLIILVVFALLLANDPGSSVTWDVVDALYYAIITATTVGFGDFAPKTQYGRFLAIIFIPLTVGAMGHFLSIVAAMIMDSRRTSFQRQLESRELSMLDLELMDADGDGQVTQHEFLEFMLLAMNKVDKEFIQEMRDYFRRLDVDGTGKLSRDDLIANVRKKLRRLPKKLELYKYKQKLLERSAKAREAKSHRRGPSFWDERLSIFNLFQDDEKNNHRDDKEQQFR